jgi:hypothetical protein
MLTLDAVRSEDAASQAGEMDSSALETEAIMLRQLEVELVLEGEEHLLRHEEEEF